MNLSSVKSGVTDKPTNHNNIIMLTTFYLIVSFSRNKQHPGLQL